jgi:hypothetical protein
LTTFTRWSAAAVNLVALVLHERADGEQDNPGDGDDHRRDNGELNGRGAAVLLAPGIAQPA